jgi:hypothetical protein
MNLLIVLPLILALLLALGLVMWAWLAIAEVARALRVFGFDGMHFEDCSQRPVLASVWTQAPGPGSRQLPASTRLP